MTQPDQTVLMRQTSGFKQLLSNAFLGLLVVFNVGNAAWAQGVVDPTPNPQNLATLYTLAKQNDPAFKAAASQLQADLETENQAFSALLPNINLGVRIEKQENTYDAFGMSIEASRNPGTYSLILNQALFRPQAWETYKQSQLSGEVAKLSFQQAEQDLVLRLSRAYFDLLTAQDDLASIRDQKTAIAEQLALAKANFEVGSATVTDQQEAQARFDLVVAQELAAENQLAQRELELETIVGIRVAALATLAPSTQIGAPVPNTPEAWVEQARTSNLTAQQARLSKLIAEGEINKAKYGHLPTLDLTAQMVETEQQIFDGNTGRPFDLGIDSTTIGLVMNLPIFSGGSTQSQVRQQAALLEKAINNVELANRNATQAAKSAFLGVQTSLAQVKALETALTSSELALKSNKTAYEVGIRINLDVLNAQQQFNATQRDLFKAKYASLINMLELQAVAGQLNAESLKQINQFLVQ